MHQRPRLLFVAALLAAFAAGGACSDDNKKRFDDDDDDGGGGSSTVGSGTGGLDNNAPFASGVHIDDVELNQGVGVMLARDGALLGSAEQLAPLIAGRPGLLRAMWQLDEDFVARDIQARLLLQYPDGESTTLSQTLALSGPPDLSVVEGTFSFSLDAQALRAGVSWQLSLHEIDDAAMRTPPATPPQLPADGAQDMGLWAQPMQLDLMIVPATLSCNGSGPLVLSPQDQASIEGQVFNLYPVSTLNLQFHDPVTLQVPSCNDSPAVLAALSDLRNSEGLGPEVYYHAVFSHNEQDSFNDGGYAWLLEDVSMGSDRVSYSVNFWPDEPNNVTHEVGHSHGREHTFNDSAYLPSDGSGPPCGRRETWGYGLVAWQHPQDERVSFPPLSNVEGWLVPPTDHLALDMAANVCLGHPEVEKGPAFNDIMGYAYPYWIGAYTYSALAERISAISAWSQADMTGAQWQSRQSLHGYFLRDGSTRWLLAPGVAASPQITRNDSSYHARLKLTGKGASELLPVAVKRSGEGDVGGVVVPLPEGFVVPDSGAFEVVVHGVTRAGRWSALR